MICGSQLPPVVVSNPTQGFQQYQQPMRELPWLPPPPPQEKERKPIIIVGVVIGVIAIIIILLMAFVLPGMLNPYPMREGDYLEYSYAGTIIFSGYSGTMKIEITEITSATYSITTTYTGDYYQAPSTKTYPIEDLFGETGYYDYGSYLGMENIDTAYGDKMLKHYHSYESNYEVDYWIGQETGAPYKMTIDYGSLYGTLEMDLSETNINWIINGNA